MQPANSFTRGVRKPQPLNGPEGFSDEAKRLLHSQPVRAQRCTERQVAVPKLTAQEHYETADFNFGERQDTEAGSRLAGAENYFSIHGT